jgi:hypothetical protein
VAALESDLERVLADQAHVLNSKLFGSEVFHPRQAPGRTRLASTLGAGAGPAELFARVGTAVPILPDHVHDLAFAIDIDVDWKRIGILQLLSLTATGR